MNSKEEAEYVTRKLLMMSLKDFPVKSVLVTEFIDILAEYYAAITIDGYTREIILLFSKSGGMDIEEITEKEPELVRNFVLFGASGESGRQDLSQWLSEIFHDKNISEQALSIIWNMYKLFRDKDCSLVEINPLALTPKKLLAADAKIVFDDNGIQKHPELASLQNSEEHTADELEAKEAGLSFVSLEGKIGCIINGAGLAMATIDYIKLAGGNPANFLDLGGSSNPEKVINGIRILLKNKKLKVILINIFGGLTRCDDIAEGVIIARSQLNIKIPIVIRLIGTNDERGLKILHEAGMKALRSMPDAIREAVNYSTGDLRQ